MVARETNEATIFTEDSFDEVIVWLVGLNNIESCRIIRNAMFFQAITFRSTEIANCVNFVEIFGGNVM